ncbi:DUF3667 domain-containing protein [Hymenobacter edaphi]|uniref:DUF3667 domain-containing protein n=1 Tax=Hymenobacter edaphi TaxID=2211146 RepID=A0A328B8F0_9BACT|nr:DUF3667 domain-containing protein [Hymenobacter edaphi]RAK62094.1 hypothetical protein DLM85_24465 [Hymenobacter edaphi]
MNPTLTQEAPLTADHAHATACLNCGTALHDRFCARCGQSAATHRITMAHWLHDIPHSIWHVDKGVWFTLRSMFVRPGAAIRAYVQGQRVDYFRPVALVLLVTGVYSFLAAIFHLSPLPPRPANVSQEIYDIQLMGASIISKYMSWMYVAMVPVVAAFMRLLMRRTKFNYAECLVAVAFITSASNFIAVLFLPVMYVFNGTPQAQSVATWLSLAAFGYQTWAYSTLLQNTPLSAFGRIWRGLITSVGGFLTSIFIATSILLAINWSSFKAAVKAQHAAKAPAATVQPAPPGPAPAH